MIKILILIAIYVVSVILSFKFIQKAHYDKEGRFNHSTPNVGDFIIMILPFCNTVIAISFLIAGWKENDDRFENFFKPKE